MKQMRVRSQRMNKGGWSQFRGRRDLCGGDSIQQHSQANKVLKSEVFAQSDSSEIPLGIDSGQTCSKLLKRGG